MDCYACIWFKYMVESISTLVLGVGIGVLAQPQLAVRFMTVKNKRALNRAVLVGGPFIFMITGVSFTEERSQMCISIKHKI